MKTLRLLSVVVLVTVALPPALRAAEHEDTWSTGYRETVSRVRDVGVALYRWVEAEGRLPAAPSTDEVELDLAAIPRISADELRDLLVPAYLEELPTEDAWRRTLEFRLRRDGAAGAVMAVRSAGADGRFSGERYEARPFAPGDPEDDVVWADGYFVRWPQAPGE